MNDFRKRPLPADEIEAIALQQELKQYVEIPASRLNPDTVAGVDIAYDPASARLFGAAVLIDLSTMESISSATRNGLAVFPYTPGLLAFRELPMATLVLDDLSPKPDLVVCDGHGLAHPRRFGLACHLGVVMDIAAIGVAKNPPPFEHSQPGFSRGDTADIHDEHGVVGRALRTQDNIQPLYVSVGHKIGLDEACEVVLRLTPRYRQPQTTRLADQLGRKMLARKEPGE